MKFDVEFTINRYPLRLQHRAVAFAEKLQLEEILFPSGAAVANISIPNLRFVAGTFEYSELMYCKYSHEHLHFFNMLWWEQKRWLYALNSICLSLLFVLQLSHKCASGSCLNVYVLAENLHTHNLYSKVFFSRICFTNVSPTFSVDFIINAWWNVMILSIRCIDTSYKCEIHIQNVQPSAGWQPTAAWSSPAHCCRCIKACSSPGVWATWNWKDYHAGRGHDSGIECSTVWVRLFSSYYSLKVQDMEPKLPLMSCHLCDSRSLALHDCLCL